ncbi:hypothetical protein GCM10020219_062090 [Nonomuraea dietziae]
MSAMIQNDEEKEWMLPLLELRNELDVADDRHLRDWRKMNGAIQLFNDRIVHGAPTPRLHGNTGCVGFSMHRPGSARTKTTPESVRGIELITMDELHEIRRLWVFEKHEVEDSLPRIYEEVTGEPFPGKPLDEHLALAGDEIALLREVCGDDELHFSTLRELLAVERKFRTMTRRSGLFEELEKTIRRGYYDDIDDATEYAHRMRKAKEVPQLPIFSEDTTDAPA